MARAASTLAREPWLRDEGSSSLPDEALGRQRGRARLGDGHRLGVAELVPDAAAPTLAGGGIDAARLVGERPERAAGGDVQAEARDFAVAGDGRA